MVNDGNCLYCNHPYTGRLWCKECDPDHLVNNWNIENKSIRDCILNSLKKVNNYDEPFFEYIPHEKLEIGEKIGEGSYGVVYKAKWINGLRYIEGNKRNRDKEIDVAVKEIKGGHDILSMIEAHLKCLDEDRKYVTQKLLKLYGIAQNPVTKDYIIVMDFKDGSLRNYLDNEIEQFQKLQQSQWTSRTEILYNVSSGMKRIHKAECIHGNLHCGNILVETKKERIPTFIGGIRFSSDIKTSPKSNMNVLEGVLPYIAPEVLCGQPKTKESDVYSFGVIMCEMTTGKPPFCDTPHDESLARRICEAGLRPEINKNLAPSVYFTLAKKCLDSDPKERPTIEKLEETLGFWYDSLFGHDLFPDRRGEAMMVRESFNLEPFNIDVRANSVYTIHRNASYIGKTLGFSQFSEPKKSEDHYIY